MKRTMEKILIIMKRTMEKVIIPQIIRVKKARIKAMKLKNQI
jgi:hypothetical protein